MKIWTRTEYRIWANKITRNRYLSDDLYRHAARLADFLHHLDLIDAGPRF